MKLFRPRLLVVGASAYPRILDYARFRKIAESVGAIMMVDIVRTFNIFSLLHIAS